MGDGHRHPRRPALAGARLGRGAGRRRAARAVLPVAAARSAIARRPHGWSASGRAYYCYCTPEMLQQKRQAAEAAGGGWVYDRTCCTLDGRADRRARGGRHAARGPFQGARPARRVRRSRCTARSSSTTRTSKTSSSCARTASRPITCRSSSTTSTWRSPTWSAATITSRTRRSRCCSTRRSARTPPTFAHVPLILGPDKKRLSKRHGATSVMEYHAPRLPARGDGELPGAARLVAGRRPRAVHARRAGRALHARGHQRRQRRVQSREARLVQPAAHHAAAAGRACAAGSSRCCARPGLWSDDCADARARLAHRAAASWSGRASSGSGSSSTSSGRSCRSRRLRSRRGREALSTPGHRAAPRRAGATLDLQPFDQPALEAAFRHGRVTRASKPRR